MSHIPVLALNPIYISRYAFCFCSFHMEDRTCISSSELFGQCLSENFPSTYVLDLSREYTWTIPTSHDKLEIGNHDLRGDFRYNHH